MAAGRISLAHGLLARSRLVAAGGHSASRSTTNLITAASPCSPSSPTSPSTRRSSASPPSPPSSAPSPAPCRPLLGWTAARGIIEWPAVALFAILFVWQFPHFMAIAWLYREDYARAGIRMLPVVQPDGRSTVIEALFYAVLMIPVSLVPGGSAWPAWTYAIAAALSRPGLPRLHHPLRPHPPRPAKPKAACTPATCSKSASSISRSCSPPSCWQPRAPSPLNPDFSNFMTLP